MFTGIIEQLGIVTDVQTAGTNQRFTVRAPFTAELQIDQSVAHDGVCLTVVALQPEVGTYHVTAIQETLDRTTLRDWQPGALLNLERCLAANGRFDGHIVQGHVDTTAELREVRDENGSWRLFFTYAPGHQGHLTVEKGSITINGISLTVVDSGATDFSVAIIPYTWEHTNLHRLRPGDRVNLEFDIVGKYVAKILGKG